MNAINLLPYRPQSRINKAQAHQRLKELKVDIDYLEQELAKKKLLFGKWETRYKRFDRELAERDGRLKVIELKKERKPRIVAETKDLTYDQLCSIAKKLGLIKEGQNLDGEEE